MGTMMKILLVLTGGTICSSKNENGLNELSTGMAVPSLVSMYEELIDESEKDVEFETIAPINTLSENMTITKWNTLIGALKEVDFGQYDGVIMLHGTDTLHLTSALMGVLLRNVGCPVMMVSAHRILDDPESNGPDNFLKSVRFIRKLNEMNEGGVFVVYRNTDGVSFVHHATHLEECGDYSEDFYSGDMIEYEKMMKNWDSEYTIFKNKIDNSGLHNSYYSNHLSFKEIGELTDNVLYIKPYVGINYDRINLDGVKAVFHNMYHSSTINTEGDGPTSALSLLQRCNELGIDFYIFPCKEGSFRYSSTAPLIEEGAKCIYGGTWEEAYIKLLLTYNK